MKQKHCEMIKAWAEGATIQYSANNGNSWTTCTGRVPAWEDSFQYRVKPIEYPKSTLNYVDLCAIVSQAATESSNEGVSTRIARAAANEAVQHFITSGEMVKFFTNPDNGFITKDNS